MRDLWSRGRRAMPWEGFEVSPNAIAGYATPVLQRRSAQNGVIFYQSPLLAATGVLHAFSTRIGGVSDAPFDSLNLGNPAGDLCDDPGNIQANYQRLQEAIHCGQKRRCWVHQVHGNHVACADRGDFADGAAADALVSRDPQLALAVRVADCVPILIATDDGAAVAAVHAGWRGVILGMVPAAVRALIELSGTEARHLIAAIGPCISEAAFEVGPEVISEFVRVFDNDAPLSSPRGPAQMGHVDLRAAVRLQLLNSHVPAEQIDLTDRCTVRDTDEFFSHRRENGVTGRMAAVISPADPRNRSPR